MTLKAKGAMNRELLKRCAEALDPFDHKRLLKEIETELAKPEPEPKPIGYIPRYVAGVITRDGMWEAFTIYRTRTDPTDIEVYL